MEGRVATHQRKRDPTALQLAAADRLTQSKQRVSDQLVLRACIPAGSEKMRENSERKENNSNQTKHFQLELMKQRGKQHTAVELLEVIFKIGLG